MRRAIPERASSKASLSLPSVRNDAQVLQPTCSSVVCFLASVLQTASSTRVGLVARRAAPDSRWRTSRGRDSRAKRCEKQLSAALTRAWASRRPKAIRRRRTPRRRSTPLRTRRKEVQATEAHTAQKHDPPHSNEGRHLAPRGRGPADHNTSRETTKFSLPNAS